MEFVAVADWAHMGARLSNEAVDGKGEWRWNGATVLAQGARNIEVTGHDLRDRSMAENVRALLEAEGPDAKIVLWSHNGHAGRFRTPTST